MSRPQPGKLISERTIRANAEKIVVPSLFLTRLGDEHPQAARAPGEHARDWAALYNSYQRVCCYLSMILARCGSTALAAALPPYEHAASSEAIVKETIRQYQQDVTATVNAGS